MSQEVSQPEPERLLSADELAPLLGMSLDWVYERAKSGALPSIVLPGGPSQVPVLGGSLGDGIGGAADGVDSEEARAVRGAVA